MKQTGQNFPECPTLAHFYLDVLKRRRKGPQERPVLHVNVSVKTGAIFCSRASMPAESQL
jgi:hypothetical protein